MSGLPEYALQRGAERFRDLDYDHHMTASVDVANAVLLAAAVETPCPECWSSGTQVREGTPYPIRRALGAPDDSELVPCDLCGGSGTIWILRVAATPSNAGSPRA